jgi:RNA polymerase sigma factor (TIGR02999 family)
MPPAFCETAFLTRAVLLDRSRPRSLLCGIALARECQAVTSVSHFNSQLAPTPTNSLAQEPPLNGRPNGGASPEINQIFRETYFELRRIAHSRLYRNERLTLLDTTSLVHECYLRLSNAELPSFSSPSEMLGYSARVMRSVVVDFIRRRHAQCRGGDLEHTSLDGLEVGPMLPCEQEILDVDEAIQVLAQAEPRLAQVVEMKYFGGFTEPEIAESLGITERTVRRDWEKARELLRVALGR